MKLTVSVSPSTIVEGSTATGTVTHNNSSVSSPVTVTLSSSDTSEATVAATVTIPAGTNTVNFAVTAMNDGIADGPQPVTITTAATGYASASTNVTVKDAPAFQYVLTLPELPSDATGHVEQNDLNNHGQMVGWYSTAEGRKGYLYDSLLPSGLIDLTALTLPGIPPGNSGYSSASDINNAGDIIGGDDVYRDDRGWRSVTDLAVIGQNDDVLLWLSSAPWAIKNSDRVTSDDVGHISGSITIGGVSYNSRPFVLTPVPVP